MSNKDQEKTVRRSLVARNRNKPEQTESKETNEPFAEMRLSMFGSPRPSGGSAASPAKPLKPQREKANHDDKDSRGVTVPHAKVDRVEEDADLGIPRIGAPAPAGMKQKAGVLGRIPIYDNGIDEVPAPDATGQYQPDLGGPADVVGQSAIDSAAQAAPESRLHKIEDGLKQAGKAMDDPSSMPGQGASTHQYGIQGLDKRPQMVPMYDEGGAVRPLGRIRMDGGPVKNDPYDSHHSLAILEEGERVLTPSQNRQYEKEHGIPKVKMYDDGGVVLDDNSMPRVRTLSEQNGFPVMRPVSEDTGNEMSGARVLQQPNPEVSVSEDGMPRMRTMQGANISNPRSGDLFGDTSNPNQTEAAVPSVRTMSAQSTGVPPDTSNLPLRRPELAPLFTKLDNEKYNAAGRGTSGLSDFGTALLHERELERHNDRTNAAESSGLPRMSSYLPELNGNSAEPQTTTPASPESATRALQEEMIRAEKAKDLNAYNAAKTALDAQQSTATTLPKIDTSATDNITAKPGTPEYKKALHDVYVQGLAKQQELKDKAAARGDRAAYEDASDRIRQLHSMNPWGGASNHSGILGKIGHDAFSALKIAGDVGQVALATEFPAAAEFLPIYSPDRHEAFQRRAAELAGTQAKTGLDVAETGLHTAQTSALKNPVPQLVKGEKGYQVFETKDAQGNTVRGLAYQHPRSQVVGIVPEGENPSNYFDANGQYRAPQAAASSGQPKAPAPTQWTPVGEEKTQPLTKDTIAPYVSQIKLIPDSVFKGVPEEHAGETIAEKRQRISDSLVGMDPAQAKEAIATLRQTGEWVEGKNIAEENRKTAERVAFINKQATLQSQQQKWGMEHITTMWSDPQHGYASTASIINSTESSLKSAQTGDELANSLEPVMISLGLNSFAGIHRVSPSEVQNAGPQVGSVIRQINTFLDKAGTGKVSPETTKEALALMERLRGAKYASMVTASQLTASNSGLNPQQVTITDKQGTDTTTLSKALAASHAIAAGVPKDAVGIIRDEDGNIRQYRTKDGVLHDVPQGK